MHSCLHIPEILGHIFDQCYSWDNAILARVCKDFNDIALDRVWRSVDSIVAFTGCLPPDVAVSSEGSSEGDPVRPFSNAHVHVRSNL